MIFFMSGQTRDVCASIAGETMGAYPCRTVGAGAAGPSLNGRPGIILVLIKVPVGTVSPKRVEAKLPTKRVRMRREMVDPSFKDIALARGHRLVAK